MTDRALSIRVAVASALAILATSVVFAPSAVGQQIPETCVDVTPEEAERTIGQQHTLTARLREASGTACTTSPTTNTSTRPFVVQFDVFGANDSGTAPELRCSIGTGDDACTVQYSGSVTGNDTITGWLDNDRDETLDDDEPRDTVQVTWIPMGDALDCDLDARDDSERRLGLVPGGSVTILCSAVDGQGVGLATGTIVAEIENGINDPDEPDGPSYGSPDATCAIDAGGCSLTLTPSEGELGISEICLYLAGQEERCSDEGTDEGRNTSGVDAANDPADQVEVRWVSPTTAVVVTCVPDASTSTTAASFEATCTATDGSGAAVRDVSIVAEATGANDPDAADSPTSPDFGCTTRRDGSCVIAIRGTAGVEGTTVLRAWIDADLSATTVEADLEEGTNASTDPGSSPEPDGTDVIIHEWSGSPARLVIEPNSDLSTVGACNPITVRVLTERGDPAPGVILTVEQVHSLSNDGIAQNEPAVSFCEPASGANPSGVDTSGGDLVEQPSDDPSTSGGHTRKRTDPDGLVTLGIRVLPSGAADGSGTTTVTIFLDQDADNDPDGQELQGESETTWIVEGARRIQCGQDAEADVGETTATRCTVIDRFGDPVSNVGVVVESSGVGEVSSSTELATDGSGQVTITASSDTPGTQLILTTLADDRTGAEPGDVDACDRAAGDPAGAPPGQCSDEVAIEWLGTGQNSNCPGAMNAEGNHIVGTPGPDQLVGTPGIDVICGLGGGDTISGLGGNDILLGGDGPNSIKGGGGKDLIKAKGADDVIDGGGGDDTIRSAGGDDVASGGSGADKLYGEAGNDLLRGGASRDLLSGGKGDDLLDGGGGGDRCRSGSGDDAVRSC